MSIEELNQYSLEHDCSIIINNGKLCGFRKELWR